MSATSTDKLQVWEVAEPYLNVHCKLGEGPFYEAETNRLRFVDIRQRRLHTVDLAAGPASLHTLEVDSPISVTADIEGVDPREKLAVGLKYGLAVLDRQTGQYTYLHRFSEVQTGAKPKLTLDYERLRGNDGGADPLGRFWLASMTDFPFEPFGPAEGALYVFGRGGATGELIRPDLVIPNSVGFAPDGRTMYFTHTVENKVFAFDFDPVDGGLSNERVHYHHPGPGSLDGFRVDVEGNIWHAVYGGSRVVKIAPTGQVVGEVRLPTANITCTQFAGTTLFMTSAADDAAEGGEASKANGGGLFCVDVGVEGLPLYKFQLGK